MCMGIPQRARVYQHDYRAREDVSRTWRCHSALADIPPADIPLGLVQNPPTDITQTNMNNDEYPEMFGREECIDSNLHLPLICSKHQHGWENGDILSKAIAVCCVLLFTCLISALPFLAAAP